MSSRYDPVQAAYDTFRVAAVPVWMSAVTLFIVLPTLHYKLLTSKSVPSSIVTATISLLFFAFPNLFPCQDLSVDIVFKGSGPIYFVLRTLEIATFPRDLTRAWSVMDYLEFMFTSDNKPLRKLRQMEEKKDMEIRKRLNLPLKSKTRGPRITSPEELKTARFYIWLAIEFGLSQIVYCFAKAYLSKYPYESYGNFLSLDDKAGVAVHLAFCALMYTQMSTTYTLSTLPVVILLDAPFIHMFKEPYFSTSLSDFWSHRWNYPIKETMHRLGFLPTLQALSAFDSRKNGITQKPPMYHLAIASFAAFVASAIFHEYVVFMFMTNEPFGQNGAFFLLNGVLCVIQHLFQHVTGLGHTWGKGPLWNLLGWGVTLTILLKTSPLFVGTYARSGVMMLWPVPKILFDYFQSVI